MVLNMPIKLPIVSKRDALDFNGAFFVNTISSSEIPIKLDKIRGLLHIPSEGDFYQKDIIPWGSKKISKITPQI